MKYHACASHILFQCIKGCCNFSMTQQLYLHHFHISQRCKNIWITRSIKPANKEYKKIHSCTLLKVPCILWSESDVCWFQIRISTYLLGQCKAWPFNFHQVCLFIRFFLCFTAPTHNGLEPWYAHGTGPMPKFAQIWRLLVYLFLFLLLVKCNTK